MMTMRLLFLLFLFSYTALFSNHKNNTGNPPKEKFVVVLDAGHGGHDPGNLGNGYLEKNIALRIVLQAGRELEKNPNIKVIYTRKDDTFVDLFVRGKIANEAKADLFVSVHCDSHTSNAYGAGTFVMGLHKNKQNFDVAKKENSVIYLESDYQEKYAQYDINSPESVIGLTIMQEEFLQQSILLGKKLQDVFTKRLNRKDRKVKQAGFIVLHQTFMPSVLVEAGFLTNKDEGSYLNSSKGQSEMGKAIADAVLAYKAEVDNGLSALEFQEIPDAPEETPEEVVEETKEETPAVVEVTKEVKPTIVEATKPKVKDPEPVKETSVAQKKPHLKKEVVSQSDVIFKVQLVASGRDIPLKPENFNGLNQLSKEPFKNLFRYMYGNATSYDMAQQLKAEASTKGYTSAYIVAYRNGTRVPVTNAMK
ncbi:MAG: N-acetylmuramoyl-L-alanine amidase [Bacteroidota bacterium]